MKFNGIEFAKKMREGKCVDLHGNVVCSLELWERIASIIEDQSDEVDRLLNLMCKIDREQAERIQEEYVPYEQYEELLEENKQLKLKHGFFYRGARGSGKTYELAQMMRNEAVDKLVQMLVGRYHEFMKQVAKEIIDEN